MLGVGMARLVVDNSNGSDPAFAADLARDLEGHGFEVELRRPRPGAMFDTAVHVVDEGVAVRVMDEADSAELAQVAAVTRSSESRRTGRKRYRSVPIYRGETRRVLRWVDVFD
jgi:hypothetical protein